MKLMKDRREPQRGRRSKVTSEIRHQLMQVHIHLGYEASRPLCLEHGVHQDYAAKEVLAHGLSRPYKPRGGGDISTGVDHNDPRWKLAIERGSVTA